MRHAAVLLTLGWLRIAYAQPATDAFAQAEEKFARGDRAGACALYEQALANEAQLPWKSAFLASTKLALCKKEAHKLASAVALYRHAAEILHTQKSAENAQRAVAAEKAAAELDKQVSQLTIAIAPDVAKLDGMRVTLDGRDVATTDWNKAIAKDGGKYTIHATASGHRDFDETVTLGDEKDTKTVTVVLAASDVKPIQSAPIETAPRKNRVPAYVAGGVGVIALGIAVGFELSARGTYDEYAKDEGHPQATLDAANGKRHIANGFAIGGGLAIAAAAALWFLWPEETQDAKVSVMPVLGSDIAGAQASVRW